MSKQLIGRFVVLGVIVGAGVPAHALRVGTFDAARAGQLAFGSSAQTSETRTSITGAFSGATFVETSTLSASFLSGVNVVMLASPTSGNSAITPLSASEQSALRAFVDGGGSAVIFVDNDSFDGGNSDPANESLIDPFGFDVVGTTFGSSGITALNTSNPITGGPFGTVPTSTFHFTGFFDQLGPGGVNVANVDAFNNSGVAYVPRGTYGLGSGAVVLFSDTSFVYNGFTSASGHRLVNNALAYAAVPEPGTLLALSAGLVTLARRRARRASR